MNERLSFSSYSEGLKAFIRRHSTEELDMAVAEREFTALALSLFQLQHASVLPLQRLCESRGVHPSNIENWKTIPAVPARSFKDFDLTSLSPEDRLVTFHSSGTTAGRRSRHFHSRDSLDVYEQSLLPWFGRHVLPDFGRSQKLAFIFLTPSPALAPNSSLVHMLETIRREFGSAESMFTAAIEADAAWKLDLPRILSLLETAKNNGNLVAIAGTAFSFVHLLDHMAERGVRLAVPAGSRVMETGGYKGRSREISKMELHALISEYLSVPPSHIICEYGMSELSSQAYDQALGETSRTSRAFQFPPWARVQIISTETGAEVSEGEIGLVRVFDLANARSVIAIQTEDLAIKCGEGFQLIGRAALAEPRGCSLMPR